MAIVSGRKTKARVMGYIPYGLLSVLDRIEEKTGNSRSSIIALCVEQALPDVARNERLRVPKHLPVDRQEYLFWRYGL